MKDNETVSNKIVQLDEDIKNLKSSHYFLLDIVYHLQLCIGYVESFQVLLINMTRTEISINITFIGALIFTFIFILLQVIPGINTIALVTLSIICIILILAFIYLFIDNIKIKKIILEEIKKNKDKFDKEDEPFREKYSKKTEE